MTLTLDEKREKRDRLRGELADLRTRPSTSGNTERIRNLIAGLDATEAEIADAEFRLSRIAELAKRPENREDPMGALQNRSNTMSTKPKIRGEGVSEVRDKALRSIDDAFDRGQLDEPSGARLVDLVSRDKFDLDARYVAAISDPDYERAFAKKLTGFDGAEGVLSAKEAEAMQAVGRAMATRAMAVGEGSTGGFAVPLSLDPSIILTNAGAINPIRELATVKTISTTKWQGVSSAGVEVVFDGEAEEAPDKSPTLAQPEIVPEKAHAFVPFSIEVGMDWSGIAAELARLFADAKAVKEAEIFATGSGSENIPQGLVTGATKTVATATKEVVAAGDVYALQEALGPRYQPNAVWLGAGKVANQIYRFVAEGDTEEPRLMNEERTAILGKPWREVSTMSAKTTTGNEKVLLYGDIAEAYRIVDRIGMTAEIVPHLFGENGRPSGQRGLYVYFRVGAKVIVPDAVQALKVKAS